MILPLHLCHPIHDTVCIIMVFLHAADVILMLDVIQVQMHCQVISCKRTSLAVSYVIHDGIYLDPCANFLAMQERISFDIRLCAMSFL